MVTIYLNIWTANNCSSVFCGFDTRRTDLSAWIAGFRSRRVKMPGVVISSLFSSQNCTFSICALAGQLTSGGTAIFGIICAMRVFVVALDDVFDLGLSAILDAFQTANELIQMTGLAVPQFEVKIVGMRKSVRAAHGLKVPIQPA